jgi:hypothetical protein
MTELYEQDFHAWSTGQAARRRADLPADRPGRTAGWAPAHSYAPGAAATGTGLALAALPPGCPWSLRQAMQDAP